MEYKTTFIKNILNSPPTNSKLTRTFCNEHFGPVPVYGSSKDEQETLGYIKDNISKVKYYNNCLSYNRNGSVGYVFYRNHKFSTNEDHRVLVLKPEFKNIISYEYLKYTLENELLKLFSYTNKAGISKINDIAIKIPTKKDGNFDLKSQDKIAEQYKNLRNIKNSIMGELTTFKKTSIQFKIKSKTKEFLLAQIATLIKGDSKYTHRYIIDHQGQYPVYSSQTSDDGIIGYIDSYDHNLNCLSWTTDGIYAGKLFKREGKFNMTTHCGAILIKDDFKEKIDINYLYHFLKNLLPGYAVGEGNKRLTVELIKNVPIELPINKDGDIDLRKQKDIAKMYDNAEVIKKNMDIKISKLLNLNINL